VITGCDHPLCNREITENSPPVTEEEVRFMLDCAVVQGTIIYVGNDHYQLAKDVEKQED
jgi:hypothetical protein